MKIILETERLVLRTFTPDDAQMFFDLNKDLEILEWIDEKPLKTLEEAETVLSEKILKGQYDVTGYGRWAIHIKKNGLFIGYCGLKNVEGELDLGFRLKKKFRGKGFATEAALAVIDYGFQQLDANRIVARVKAQNKACIAVLEKAGMQSTEEKPSVFYDLIFEIKRQDWLQR
ncbi:MAG: GNAT family N-acetyltransferase [Flavobacteriaceae bacterium]|nr:GNAT family N-acetyltransferase [Flavobacteriaceae bacterium]